MASDWAAGIRRFEPTRVVVWTWCTVGSRVRSYRDRRDERRALRRRAALGRRRWLVSWQPEEGGWRARLSCPGLESTLERTGTTRAQAIDRTARALTRILDFHQQRDISHPQDWGLD